LIVGRHCRFLGRVLGLSRRFSFFFSCAFLACLASDLNQGMTMTCRFSSFPPIFSSPSPSLTHLFFFLPTLRYGPSLYPFDRVLIRPPRGFRGPYRLLVLALRFFFPGFSFFPALFFSLIERSRPVDWHRQVPLPLND